MVPAVGGTGTLTSSSPDCLGQALGAGQSEVGAVGGRRGEQITQHSGKCSLRAIPKQQCTCPIPYTTDMMSLNPLQPYWALQFAYSFQKSDTGLTGTGKLSQTMARCGKPLGEEEYIGISPVAIYMVCITDCCANQDTQQHQVKQSANYLSQLLCEGCMGFSV